MLLVLRQRLTALISGIAHEPYIRRKDMEGKLKTTHIIIPDQSYRSQRLGTAQEWGIKVVYPQWIRDMALQHPVSSHARLQSMMADPVKIESADNLETAGPSSDDVTDDDKPLKGCRVHVPRRTEVCSIL